MKSIHILTATILALLLTSCRTIGRTQPVAALEIVATDTGEVAPVEANPLDEPAPTATPDRLELQFDGDRAMLQVEAQMAFGPRIMGTEGSYQAGEYILAEAASHGYLVEDQPFTYLDVEGRNLIAKSGDQKDSYIVVGAHYDTRIFADEDPEFPDQPVPGANDGASGVAVLLELARTLAVDQVEHDVWLVFFDAEDNGRIAEYDWIVGSTLYVQSLDPDNYPEYMILADLVGDSDQNIYREINSDDVLTDILWDIADDLGYSDTIINEDKYSILDDHIPFVRAGIPAANMIDFDYPYWHTIEDTTDKLSAESLERVGRTIEVYLESGGIYPESPTSTVVPEE